jgi:hypothetical protein
MIPSQPNHDFHARWAWCAEQADPCCQGSPETAVHVNLVIGVICRSCRRSGFESPGTNPAPSAARAPVEHGFSDLKHWRILSRRRLDPAPTTVLRALLVLTRRHTSR